MMYIDIDDMHRRALITIASCVMVILQFFVSDNVKSYNLIIDIDRSDT